MKYKYRKHHQWQMPWLRAKSSLVGLNSPSSARQVRLHVKPSTEQYQRSADYVRILLGSRHDDCVVPEDTV